MFMPASLLRKHGYAVGQAHPHTITPGALKVLDPDAIVFQLHQTQPQQEKIKTYRKACRDAFLVYETDDLFWAVPEGSWHHKTNPLLPNAKANIRATAKLCDAITASTPELAEEMRRLTGMRDVRVAPNYVPQSFVNAALSGRRSSNVMKSALPRVGWAGGIGHGGDLAVLTDVVKETRNKIQWVFLGMTPPGIEPGENVEVHGGLQYSDYGEFLGRLGLDLALAPLENNAFNRCKSDLRVLEYAAAGYPVIASDLGTYQHCPVRFSANTPEAWQRAIDDALNDKDLPKQAEDLHEWLLMTRVAENYLEERVRAYLPKHTDIFQPNLGGRFTGQVVSVSAERIDELPRFDTFEDAWSKMPGADILYVRPGTDLSEHIVAQLINELDQAASVSALSNDCGYPDAGAFQSVPSEGRDKLRTAAAFTQSEPIERPYPSGPVAVFAGPALARFGLPDERRFESLEYAFADWGVRASELGHRHLTGVTSYVVTDYPLQHSPALAQRAVEHLSMWSPGFLAIMQMFQASPSMAAARADIDLAFAALFHQAPTAKEYADWYRLFCTITDDDREIMRKEIQEQPHPLINIILPVFNTNHEHLRACLDSVLDQVYGQWKLCVCNDGSSDPEIARILAEYADKDIRINLINREKNGHICAASNDALSLADDDDWTVFLDHDDTLPPHALWMIARETVRHPEAQFIYTDCDKISPEGKLQEPYFTPDFAYELLLAQNYVTHLCAYRTPIIKELKLREGLEGSQDWDLVLRYLEQTCGTPPDEKLIRHIPQIGYHWRQSEQSVAYNAMAKPYAHTAARAAVGQHLHRTEQTAFLAPNPVMPIFLMLRFMVPNPLPKVAVIILTRDNPVQFGKCIDSLLERTVYGNYTVIVVDNGTKTPALPGGGKAQLLKVSNKDPFNFAALNNKAVEKAEDAEFICFLNDDTEIIEGSWLMDLVGLARRDKVGAVGTKLLFPDNTVQHGGIAFSPEAQPGESAIHLWQKFSVNEPGQAGRAVITQPVTAVTAACMVIRRATFLEVGGFDAEHFPVDYNDVDLCLRLRTRGYRNIVSAQAYVRHDAGSTKRRGHWDRSQHAAAERILTARYSDMTDPYVNPNVAFTPWLRALAPKADKPWRETAFGRRLLINPADEDIERNFLTAHTPFVARLEGHYLVFSEPPMPNLPPIDMRGSTEMLQVILQKLGIEDVSFYGVGDGTLGAVGYFATLAETGWPVTCVKGADLGNEHHYIDPAGWWATWERLVRLTGCPEKSATAAAL
jgi:GT2 family glycosyltransferase/glycosyltransferase involved in cell wall biosynthesis